MKILILPVVLLIVSLTPAAIAQDYSGFDSGGNYHSGHIDSDGHYSGHDSSGNHYSGWRENDGSFHGFDQNGNAHRGFMD